MPAPRPAHRPIARRGLLVTTAATALTLGTVSFADAADAPEGATRTRTVRGVLPTGSPDYVYLPVDVGHGVAEIAVSYTYEKPPVPAGTQGNALDIGIFDERGTELGGPGFRGGPAGRATASSSGPTRRHPDISRGRCAPGPGTSCSLRTPSHPMGCRTR